MFFRYGKLTSQTDVQPDLDDPQNADLLNNSVNAQENLDQRSQAHRQSVMSERAPAQNNSFNAGAQSDYNFSNSQASRPG